MPRDLSYRFKFIVPFYHYSKDPDVNSYDLINRTLYKNNNWSSSVADIIQQNEVLDHILHSMDGEQDYSKQSENGSGRSICSIWKNDNVSKRNCRYIKTKKKESTIIDFALNNVELFLFWNHVGMLCYEIEPSDSLALSGTSISEVTAISEFQNNIIKLGQRKEDVLFGEELSENVYDNNVIFDAQPLQDADQNVGKRYIRLINQNWKNKYISEKDLTNSGSYFSVQRDSYYINESPENSTHTRITVYKPLNISLWVEYVLGSLIINKNVQIGYFASVIPFKGEPDRHIVDKAIPFTYASLNETVLRKPETQKDITYKLGNGYPTNYSSISITEDFWEHSADVLWYSSRQGCCCTIKKGSSLPKYFKNLINSNKNDGYFLLYLLQLNQTYGLIYYSKVISENFTSDVCSYTKDNVLLQRKLQRINAEINLFFMKSAYTSISNIQKQNEFFSYLRKQLSVGQDIQSIKSGLEGLGELQDSLTKIENDKRTDTYERRLNLSLGLLALLAIISTLNDLKDLLLGEASVFPLKANVQTFLFFAGVVIIILITGFVLRTLLSYKSNSAEKDIDH